MNCVGVNLRNVSLTVSLYENVIYDAQKSSCDFANKSLFLCQLMKFRAHD